MKTVLLFRTSFSPQNRFEYRATFDFGRVFKRYTGLTPRNWQKQQCKR